VYKEYSTWFKLKKYLNNYKKREYFYEREIWYCYLGENIGYEQDGKGKNFLRPVLIYKKFNRNSILVIPLTSKVKTGKYYFKVKIKNKDNYLILSQIKFLDTKRLFYKIDKIEKTIFETIKSELMTLLS
jgi:mRNA interferase MazF